MIDKGLWIFFMNLIKLESRDYKNRFFRNRYHGATLELGATFNSVFRQIPPHFKIDKKDWNQEKNLRKTVKPRKNPRENAKKIETNL